MAERTCHATQAHGSGEKPRPLTHPRTTTELFNIWYIIGTNQSSCFGNHKKAGVAILISDKINFKIKTITRDKEGHYIMIKESIQEYVTIVNIYAPKISASQ